MNMKKTQVLRILVHGGMIVQTFMLLSDASNDLVIQLFDDVGVEYPIGSELIRELYHEGLIEPVEFNILDKGMKVVFMLSLSSIEGCNDES